MNFLLVGGGGGAGTGGGGAGGIIEGTVSVTQQGYAVTVGAGGAASSNVGVRGSMGGDSLAFGSKAGGGGGGGRHADSGSTSITTGAAGRASTVGTGVSTTVFVGGAGGGGGATQFTATGGSGASPGGFAGGAGTLNYGGGGGGTLSSGTDGGNGTSSAGRGGAGTTFDITGTTATYAVGGDGLDPTLSRTSTGAGSGGDFLSAGVKGVVIVRYEIALDTTPPTVSSVSVPAGGSYKAGDALNFTVNASEAVTVTGTPQIALTIGSTTRQATFVSGSGSTALLFRYTVQAGDMDADGIAVGSLSADGGTLQDSMGNNMTLTLNNVGSTAAVLVDTTVPTVAVTGAPVNVNSTASFPVTITFSESVTGFDVSDITVGNGAASSLAGSGTSYTADITPDGNGNVTIDVAVGVAQDAAANANTASTQVSVIYDAVAPTVAISGPSSVVTESFAITFTFSEIVTGFEVSDIVIANGTLGTLTGSGSTYSVLVTPVLGTIVVVSLPAGSAYDAGGNGNQASDEFTVQAGSPASEFERSAADIRRVILDDAGRSLRSTLNANQNMVRDARGRLISKADASRACGEVGDADQPDDCVGVASRDNVPFDVDGGLIVNGSTLSTSGTFFGQTSTFDGSSRRLVLGEFDIQYDRATGSSTATLIGRVAWERMVSDRTMLGYFIGGEVSQSNIVGAFEGDNRRLGLTFGGYAVHEVRENLFADGFLSLGAGRNNLAMANDVLDLESDYTTRTLTFGASLSGVIDRGHYQFLPELAFSYGRTWIGDVGFSGRAYGLVNDTLSLDAGSVSLADITFRPEFRFSLDGLPVVDSLSVFSFAPRFVCEEVRTDVTKRACGGGAEIRISGNSGDGLTTYDATIIADRVQNRTGITFQLGFERSF